MVVEKIVHRDEQRELDEQRQTAGHGVVIFALVKVGHLLIELLGIVLVLRLQFLHLGLQLRHPRRGERTLLGEREKQRLNQHSDQNNGHAIVRDEAVEEIEEEFKEILEPAKDSRSLHGIFQLEIGQTKAVFIRIFVFAELAGGLRPEIEVIGVGRRGSGEGTAQKPKRVGLLDERILAGLDFIAGNRGFRHGDEGKVLAGHRHPARARRNGRCRIGLRRLALLLAVDFGDVFAVISILGQLIEARADLRPQVDAVRDPVGSKHNRPAVRLLDAHRKAEHVFAFIERKDLLQHKGHFLITSGELSLEHARKHNRLSVVAKILRIHELTHGGKGRAERERKAV